MKTFLILFFTAFAASAQHVILMPWTDITGRPLAYQQVQVCSTNGPFSGPNGAFSADFPITLQPTDTNGLTSVTNLFNGSYFATLRYQYGVGKSAYTTVGFTITTNVGTVYLDTISTVSTNLPGAANAFSMISSDLRYVSQSGTNASLRTNNGVVYLDVSATSGSNTYTGAFIGNGSGLTNVPYNNLSGVRASTNTTVQQLSSSGGGNVITDMQTGTAYYPGQIGYTYGGGASAMWFGIGTGLGTNVWGYPGNFYGGITTFGNPYWLDIPQSWNYGNGANIQSGINIVWGAGPTASRLTNAYPSGPLGSSAQPGLNIIDENPYNGAGGILIRGAFTNSARGDLKGTNADGVKIYVPQYGMQIVEIGDAYLPGETQQAPSMNFLFNDQQVGVYWSINGQRPGDGGVYQIPLMVMDNRSDFIWGIPFQIANVEMFTNILWKYSLQVDSTTGAVTATNGLITLGNLIGTGNIVASNGTSTLSNVTLINGGYFHINNLGGGGDTGQGFDVNMSNSASFNVETGNSALTWAGGHTGRNGVAIRQGQFERIAHGSTTPYIISRDSSNNDLRQSPGADTFVDEITIDTSDNVTIANNLTVSGNASAATFIGAHSGNGSLLTGLPAAQLDGSANVNNTNWGSVGTTIVFVNTNAGFTITGTTDTSMLGLSPTQNNIIPANVLKAGSVVKIYPEFGFVNSGSVTLTNKFILAGVATNTFTQAPGANTYTDINTDGNGWTLTVLTNGATGTCSMEMFVDITGVVFKTALLTNITINTTITNYIDATASFSASAAGRYLINKGSRITITNPK